jgi:hypothetical protein
MAKSSELRVTSHVGRDLLQAAAIFKTEATVVWEYVVNSLQYVGRGVAPRVQVTVKKGTNPRIQIADNGLGMSREKLEHFFTMHGENIERLEGRPGRGKFGTGKSAAFAVANTLEVDTCHNGLRNTVTLERKTIEKSKGEDIPVKPLISDEATESPNGTIVTLGDLLIKRIDTAAIISYIERHLQAFRKASPEVAVNNHICSYREPKIAQTWNFQPSEEQVSRLGKVSLTIKASMAPLADFDQGVAITSGVGNLVAVEKGGVERKEFGNYLFGEIDVPALESYKTEIAPYDSTRNLELNPKHPVAAVLIGFIGSKLEIVRKELVAGAKEARRTEQARRLAATAQKIADLLNKDFSKIKQRLSEIRSASARPGEASARFGSQAAGDTDESVWVRGTEEPGEVFKTGKGQKGKGGKGREMPDIAATGQPERDGTDAVDRAGGSGTKRAKPKGGFRVDYQNLGDEEDRSRYDETSLAILINLDHPVVDAALGDGPVEDVSFLRLSYEIAFSEYAMALGYEILKQDPNTPADDLLYEVRSSLNRISKASVGLYR